MVGAIGDKIDRGEVQLFCVDSVDAESWYNRGRDAAVEDCAADAV